MSTGAVLLGQQDAAISKLRFQSASAIVGHLIPQQLAAEAKRVAHEKGLPDGAPVPFNAQRAIDQATNLALATADMLLDKVFA